MIRLAIVEDNSDYRNTLSKILQRNTEIQVIHELGSCTEMIAHFKNNCHEKFHSPSFIYIVQCMH